MGEMPRTVRMLGRVADALLVAQGRLFPPGIQREAWLSFENGIGSSALYRTTLRGALRLVLTRGLDYVRLCCSPSTNRLALPAAASIAIVGVILLGIAPLQDHAPRWTYIAFGMATVNVALDGWRRRFSSSRRYMATRVAPPLIAASLGQALTIPALHVADGPIVIGLYMFAVGGAILLLAPAVHRLYRPAIAIIALGGGGILVGDFLWFLIYLPSGSTTAWLGSLLAAIGSAAVTWSQYECTRQLPVVR